MFNFFLVLHVVSMSLVIGTLFLQSLTVVFRLRLKSADELIGIRKIQTRVHTFIYYPILAVTLFSGLPNSLCTHLWGNPFCDSPSGRGFITLCESIEMSVAMKMPSFSFLAFSTVLGHFGIVCYVEVGGAWERRTHG